MPKFNQKSKVENHPTATVNEEGGLAFIADPKTELTMRFLTWLVGEPKFYESKTETVEIETLIAQVAMTDPEYIMKLASYARNDMYLRSAPIFMLVEGAQYDMVKPFIRKWTPHIIKRADELTEVIALFISKHGQIGSGGKASLPASLKKGIADSFDNFDAYQFAKYDRDGSVKLKDVQRLVHPKPKNEDQALLFKQISNRTLPIPETWETVISVNGSTKENWESVVEMWIEVSEMEIKRVRNYMAILRNLRNLMKVGVSDRHMEMVCKAIADPNAVKYSKQFPFRFFSAWKATTGYTFNVSRFGVDPFKQNEVSRAIEKAMELSVENLPKLKGRTFITSDNSASMTQPISGRGTVNCNEIANVLASLSYYISDMPLASVFGRDFALVSLNPKDGILSNVGKMIHTDVGHSTNAWMTIKYLNDNKIPVDRILLFSDMQCYDSRGGLYGSRGYGDSLAEEWNKYKSSVAPQAMLYSFDLSGYGTLQFPENDPNVVLMSGWSDKVLGFISKYESFGQTQIQEIGDYNPFISEEE